MMTVNILNDLNFEEATLSTKPYLVYFGATWCASCKVLFPIVEKASEELSETVNFGKVDIDDATLTSEQYKIKQVPTLLLFKDGKVNKTHVGTLSKVKLLEFINN